MPLNINQLKEYLHCGRFQKEV